MKKFSSILTGVLVLALIFLIVVIVHRRQVPASSGLYGQNPPVGGTPGTQTGPGQPGGGTPPAVPAEYQALYASMENVLTTYNNEISGWDGSKYPVNYSTILISADAQTGTAVLQRGLAPVNQELDADKNLGVQAVMVTIGFPIFDKNFYTFNNQSTDLAQQFIDYYVSVAQAIHSHGMKMIVEANPIFSGGTFSNLNTGPYYQSLSYQNYISRRSAGNVIIAQQIRPDYFILQSEPSTEVGQANNPAVASAIGNPVTDGQMVGQFVTDLNNANVPGLHSSIKLGAGMGSWQPHWQQYVSAFTAIAGLDSLDAHVYFVGNPKSGDEVSIAMQIADAAHAAGKGASIAEFWPHKATTAGGGGGGNAVSGIESSNIRALDSFSFWSPYDQQFILMMMKLANYKHLDYLSSFAGLGSLNWAYLDYNSSPCSSPTTISCDNQIEAAVRKAAAAAIANQQLSPTGVAYKSYIGNLP